MNVPSQPGAHADGQREPREGLRRGGFSLLLFSTVMLQAAVYSERPMASYRALGLGAGGFEVGLVASSFAFSSLVAAVPVGRWVDRFGMRPFMGMGALLVALASLAGLAVGSVAWLSAVQMLVGIGHLLFVVASQAFAAGVAPASRAERLAAYTVAVSVGQVLGPAAAGAATRWAGDAAAAFGLAAAFAGVAALPALGLRDPAAGGIEPPASPRRRGEGPFPRGRWLDETRAVLARPGMAQAMLSSMVVLAGVDIVVAYLPQYGEARAIPVEAIGVLLSVRAACSVVSRVAMGALARRLGGTALLVGSMAAAAGSLALLPAFDRIGPLAVLMGICGLGLGLGQPMSMAWVADRAPADARATALGLRLSGNRLAQLLTPVAVGAVAGATRVEAVFWVMAGLLGATAAYVARPENPGGAGRWVAGVPSSSSSSSGRAPR